MIVSSCDWFCAVVYKFVFLSSDKTDDVEAVLEPPSSNQEETQGIEISTSLAELCTYIVSILKKKPSGNLV